VRAQWAPALELLELFITVCLEAGATFHAEYRDAAMQSSDFVFEVLTRLQARSCQIASEVLALLEAGLADGAHARWRSLHEIGIVSLLISSHGNDLAERYILHGNIESHKAGRLYQAHYASLGLEPLTTEEIDGLQDEYAQLIERYGDSYKGTYGWAAEAVGKKDPTFRDLEATVDFEHLRPFYKLASHNVHANPLGVYFRLGLLGDDQMILAGPSDAGLADPGCGATAFLGLITTTLLTSRTSFDSLVMSQILFRLKDEVILAFRSAADDLMAGQASTSAEADTPQPADSGADQPAPPGV
jgi:hypothetical protein